MRIHELLIISTIFLVGCGTTSFERYSAIDQKDKTVTVALGGEGLNGELKRTLKELGWQLIVDKGPNVVEGSLGEDTKLESYETFNTRYRLYVDSRTVDICFNGSHFILYDVSLVDNKNGSEIFTLHGSDCQNRVVDRFRKELLGEN